MTKTKEIFFMRLIGLLFPGVYKCFAFLQGSGCWLVHSFNLIQKVGNPFRENVCKCVIVVGEITDNFRRVASVVALAKRKEGPGICDGGISSQKLESLVATTWTAKILKYNMYICVKNGKWKYPFNRAPAGRGGERLYLSSSSWKKALSEGLEIEEATLHIIKTGNCGAGEFGIILAYNFYLICTVIIWYACLLFK